MRNRMMMMNDEHAGRFNMRRFFSPEPGPAVGHPHDHILQHVDFQFQTIQSH
jgi:hypothetical protein